MHLSNSPSKSTSRSPHTATMQAALQFYPWNHLDIVRMLPREHWFHRGYHSLSRTPTRDELLMRYPPFGLLHDEDWHEEMQLLTFYNADASDVWSKVVCLLMLSKASTPSMVSPCLVVKMTLSWAKRLTRTLIVLHRKKITPLRIEPRLSTMSRCKTLMMLVV